MPSDFAKIRFIADSINSTFWGSNKDEQDKIDIIRSEYAPFLYSKRSDVPNKLFRKLSKLANEIFYNTTEFDNLVSMYEDDAAQHSVQLTALRRTLAVSILFNVVLLAVALYAIGGN